MRYSVFSPLRYADFWGFAVRDTNGNSSSDDSSGDDSGSETTTSTTVYENDYSDPNNPVLDTDPHTPGTQGSTINNNNNDGNNSGSGTTTTTTTTTTAAGPLTVSVKAGDTLGDLALANNTTVAAIAIASGIDLADVNNINIGDSLTIPSGSNTTGQSIYDDIPQSVFNEKTPDQAITVDGNYYDAFGDSYLTAEERNVAESDKFSQESWSNPQNWEIVVDEQGNLDQSYTGDLGMPANANYTLPSLSDLESLGKNETGYDLAVVGNQVRLQGKYGQNYSNEDELVIGETAVGRRVDSYNDADNWRIDADERGDPQLIYVGGQVAPPTGAYSNGFITVPSLMDVDAAQEAAGLSGIYLDLEDIGGEIKVLDSYGNIFDNADQAATNDVKLQDRSDPANYEIGIDPESGKLETRYVGTYADSDFVANSTPETFKKVFPTFDINSAQNLATVRGTMDPITTSTVINPDMAFYLSRITGQDIDSLVGQRVSLNDLGVLDTLGYTLDNDASQYVASEFTTTDSNMLSLSAEEVSDPSLIEISVDSMRNLAGGFTSTFTGALKGLEVARGANDDLTLDKYVGRMADLGEDRESVDSRIAGINTQLEKMMVEEGITLSEAKDYRGDLAGQLIMLDQRKLAIETDLILQQAAFENLVEQAGIPLNERFFFELGEYLQENASNYIGDVENPELFTVKLFGALGNALGFVTSAASASVAASLATGNPVSGTIAGTASAAILGSLGNAAAAYSEAVKSGATEEQARRVSQLGLVIGSAEAIPIGKVLGNLPPNFADLFIGKVTKAAVDFFEEGVVEGAQEVMSSILNDMAAKGIYDPDRQVFSADLTEDALIGFIIGGTTNAGLTALTSSDKQKIANETGITVDQLNTAIDNPVLFADVVVDNGITKETIDQLLSDGMNISKIVSDFKSVTETGVNPDGTTIEVMANQSAFDTTKVVDSTGKAAIVYGNPSSNTFKSSPTTEGSTGVFVKIENPFTIDGILTDTGKQKLVDMFGESTTEKIVTDFKDTGTVTITTEMVETIVENGFDGVINNDTGSVTVTDNSNVSTVTETDSVTDETIVATRPEWKNEMDQMYATMGGINLSEAQSIADQYGVPLLEFGDYYKELIAVNQPWKQAVLDNYLTNGKVDFDTIKEIESTYGVPLQEFNEFYSKLSVASADGFDAGILGAFESEVEDLGLQITDLGTKLNTAQTFFENNYDSIKSVLDPANGVSPRDADARLIEMGISLLDAGYTQAEALALYNNIVNSATNEIQLGITTDRFAAAQAIMPALIQSEISNGTGRQDVINALKEAGYTQTNAASVYEQFKSIYDLSEGQKDNILGLEEDVGTLTGERDFAEGAYSTVDAALASETDRQEIINTLVQNGFDSASASSLVDTVQQIRDTDATLRSEKGFAQGAYDYVETRLFEKASREDIFAELKGNGYTDANANALLDDIQNVYSDKAALVTDVSFSQNAYALVSAQLDAGKTPAEIVELLGSNNFPTDLAQGIVDSIQSYRTTISGLEVDIGTESGNADFAQGSYDFINGQLDAEASSADIVASMVEKGFTESEATGLVNNIKNVRDDITALGSDVDTQTGFKEFAQTAYGTINTALDAGTEVADITADLVNNGFSESDATTYINAIKGNRQAFSELSSTQETTAEQRTFAQQAYNFINGQLDAETSLDQIVTELVENGYTESGATALVSNVDNMRTTLSNTETSLGTANANQMFGQTAYRFVNDQLGLIEANPDGTLSQNDVIAKLVDNGFSEVNATSLVGNVSTIRTTETTLRDQITGLESENTFAEGAYDYVNTRLDAMLGQDPASDVQITPESIVNELVSEGFDQTTAQNLVDNVTTVKDKVADLGMQLDTLGTESSFAERAYTYVNSMLDQGKTAEEISNSLVEKGFETDTASSLVTSVDQTRTTLTGMEKSLDTAQDQRTFAQRAFDFVNMQLDGDVEAGDIRQDLVDNGFSDVDADSLITDATDIRSNTSLLEANNSFAQGAYGFINTQLEAGSKSTDIIQELIDNGFSYDKAQSMVTNVVNVNNEVDTLSGALGIMEGRAEFAQTAFDYINGQLDSKVTEDVLLADLVETYGFSADNAQNFVDSVQETRFQEGELQRIKTATTTGTTFDFASATMGAPEGEDGEEEDTPTTDGPFGSITRPEGVSTTTPTDVFGDMFGGGGDGGGGGGGGDGDVITGGQQVELDEYGNPILNFDAFGRPVGTYTTQPTQITDPFEAYAMQMPDGPGFNPQQARLGPQPTQVTLDEAGFITEPVAYIPEAAPVDPTTYYNPQFNQFAEVPVGYGATTVPQSFIQQPLPAINEVTQEGIGSFLGRKPRVGAA
tara:strand:+ start:1000 stop:8004 length:7005 start_codon:yes stop_codon:yes gene_type:complete